MDKETIEGIKKIIDIIDNRIDILADKRKIRIDDINYTNELYANKNDTLLMFYAYEIGALSCTIKELRMLSYDLKMRISNELEKGIEQKQ